MNTRKDLTGQTFGRLTVIRRMENYVRANGAPCSQWLCKCECGNLVPVIIGSLTSGNTKSCGCLSREKSRQRAIERNRNQNRYEFDGDVGKCYLSNCDEYFLFDTEDYDKIKQYCWSKNGSGYVNGGLRSTGTYGVHRLIMDCPDSMVVDHINHNKLDNRKCNLRICTRSQNQWNRNVYHNKTGYRGVTYNARSNNYYASIGCHGKKHHLGVFLTAEEAYEARLKAEKFYFGEYANNK